MKTFPLSYMVKKNPIYRILCLRQVAAATYPPPPQRDYCFFTIWEIRRTFLCGKKESCLQDSPPAAGRGSDMFPLRRSAIIAFSPYRKFGELSYMVKKCLRHFLNLYPSGEGLSSFP
jgi:hypothetical protein